MKLKKNSGFSFGTYCLAVVMHMLNSLFSTMNKNTLWQ